jgi:hypothetical protein
MVFEKRGGIVIILFCLGILMIKLCSSLGVSPAMLQYNFEPGFETDLGFTIFEDNPNSILELYTLGDLNNSVHFEKTEMIGGGIFTVKLKLPQKIDIPGRHRILIGVRQKVDPELVQGNIGTSIAIQVPIYIDVPYPGRYLNIKLQGNDVNSGEPVNFKLDIKSEGTENLNITPRIEIYSNGVIRDNLLFQERTIHSQELLNLKKTWDTVNQNPGNYKAVAIVDYGNLVRDEFDFKVGSLFIDIKNYSTVFPIGKLEPFNVEVESSWNNNIDGLYADIVIFNSTSIVDNFKTTTASLIPWEKKTISGYFDTSKFSEGIYDANITLTYFGKDQGKTTTKSVKIMFFKKPSLTIWYIVGGAGLALLIILLIIKIFFLNKKGKNAKNKK